jgi:hypothetical protein
MPTFITAVLAVIAIGFGASFVLESFQRTSATNYQSRGVRLDPSEFAPRDVAASHGADHKSAEKPAAKN